MFEQRGTNGWKSILHNLFSTPKPQPEIPSDSASEITLIAKYLYSHLNSSISILIEPKLERFYRTATHPIWNP